MIPPGQKSMVKLYHQRSAKRFGTAPGLFLRGAADAQHERVGFNPSLFGLWEMAPFSNRRPLESASHQNNFDRERW